MRKIKAVLCCCGMLGLVGLRTVYKMPFVDVMVVMTDAHSKKIEEWAKARNIRIFKGNPRSEKISLPSLFDLLLSVNYIFILPEWILRKARLAALNIHASLLPKYMGRTPITWAIINDEVETGITVHEMIAEVDSGPVVYQEKIFIENEDTGRSLLSKVTKRYPSILKNVIHDVLLYRQFSRIPQELEKRTYFGKREPVDGLIDWRWSSRKVYNWVRAQTKPYPGAFGYIEGQKYRIWQVEEINTNLKSQFPGGLFKQNRAVCITCGQGAVKLIKYNLEDRGNKKLI